MSAMARVVLIALLLVVASDVAKARKVSTKTTKLDAARFEVDDVFSPLQAELLKLAGLREVEYEFPNDAKMRSLARNASPEIAKVAGSASSENDRSALTTWTRKTQPSRESTPSSLSLGSWGHSSKSSCRTGRTRPIGCAGAQTRSGLASG